MHLRVPRPIVLALILLSPLAIATPHAAAAPVHVLVDASKDGGNWWFPQAAPFNPSADHQGKMLADVMRDRGCSVTELTPNYGGAITYPQLASYGLVIVTMPYAFAPYSSSELAAYDQYVSNGGNLILGCGHNYQGDLSTACTQAQNILAHFGIGYGGTSAPLTFFGYMTAFAPHPVTDGVLLLPYNGCSFITGPGTIQMLGFANGSPMMGILPYGQGKILLVNWASLLGYESFGQPNGSQHVPQQPFWNNMLAYMAGTSTPTIPDPRIDLSGLTFAQIPGGKIRITAVCRNSGTDAEHVAVRFLVQDRGNPAAPDLPIAPDQEISFLPNSGSSPVVLDWTPTVQSARIHCIVDPDDEIAEFDELNNHVAKNVGWLISPVDDVVAQYDGDPTDDVIGQFLEGVNFANTFTAVVLDTEGVASVEFDFGQKVLVDSNPSDGWSVTYDNMGDLGSADAQLAVTIINAAGMRSEPKVKTIDMLAMPSWMRFKTQYGPIKAGVEGNYVKVGVEYKPNNTEDWMSYVFTFPEEVPILGGEQDDLNGKFGIELKIPLSSLYSWTAKGTLSIEQKYISKQAATQELGVNVVINPDKTLESVSGSFTGDVKFLSLQKQWLFPIEPPPLSLLVGLGIELFARVMIEAGANEDLTNFFAHFKPGASAQINIAGGLDAFGGLGNFQVVASPRLNVDHDVKYDDPTITQSTSGSFEFKLSVKGCVLWGKCADLFSTSLGPYAFSDAGPPPVQALLSGSQEVAEPNLPDPLAFPTMRSGPGNTLGLVWIRDEDPSPTRVDPEVMFALRDAGGSWSSAIPVTGAGGPDPWFQIDPTFAFEPSGHAVAVWVQNRITEPMAIADPPSLEDALTNQDIFFAHWDGSVWSPLAPIVADSANDLRPDAQPAVAVGPGGQGMAVWTRCLTGDPLAQGTREIYYATYSDSTFSAPAALTTNDRDDYSPTVAALPGGQALALWVRDLPGEGLGTSHNEMLSSFWNGSSWSAATSLTVAVRYHSRPSIATLPDGDAVACWIETEILPDSTAQYIIQSSRWDHTTGQWDPREDVFASSLATETPIVNADSRNIAVIAWRAHNGPGGDIFASMRNMENPQSTWTPPDTVTADSLADLMLSAAVDGQNNLNIVDLKGDISEGGFSRPGNFFDGLSLRSKGVQADVTLSDNLNFGVVPVASDLKAVAMAVSTPWPAIGVPDTLRLTVTNIGVIPNGVTSVRFTDGHPDSGGVTFANLPLAAIDPGDSLVIQAMWSPIPGAHAIWAGVDPQNTVPEQTESNNRLHVVRQAFPNVAALSIWPTPDNGAPGTTSVIRGTVKNLGGVTAGSVRTRLLVGGTTVFDSLLTNLAPGATVTVAKSVVASSGVKLLELRADPDSVLFESNETDNNALSEWRVLPDFKISASSPALTQGANYTWSARIRNDGGVNGAGVTVGFYAGHPLSGGTLLGQTTVSTLAAYDSATVSVMSPPRFGLTHLYVLANSGGVVPEHSTADNLAKKDFLIPSIPDLSIVPADIRMEGFTAPNVPFDVVAVVHNLGLAEAVAPSARLYDAHPDSGGTVLAGSSILLIPGGQQAEARFKWAIPDNDTHHVYVVIDREGAIAESNEANNLAAGSLTPSQTGVSKPTEPPLPFALLDPSPNPFRSTLSLAYTVRTEGPVRMQVFDVAGHLVRDLSPGIVKPGRHEVAWDGHHKDGRAAASGIYIIRMDAGGRRFVMRAILVR